MVPSRLPSPLEPKEIMRANDPCWCRSGKKWKKCHRDRHLKEAIKQWDIIEKIYQSFKEGYCSHPNAGPSCSNGIIRAHTVQRNGGLNAIAKNGHVTSLKRAAENIFQNQGVFKPAKIGVGSATTFRGFCNHHDTEMFRSIEGASISLNYETAFLLAFRAVSYEALTKSVAKKLYEGNRDLDCGRSFASQVFIQQTIQAAQYGFEWGERDISEIKNSYNFAYTMCSFSDYEFYSIEFDSLLPIVCSACFYPEHDLMGNSLQDILGVGLPEHITFNVTSWGAKTSAVLGWPRSANKALQFIESIRQLPSVDKANAIMQIAFSYSENTCCQPDWWDGLLPADKEYVLKLFQTDMLSGNLRRTDSIDLNHRLGEAGVVSEKISIN